MKTVLIVFWEEGEERISLLTDALHHNKQLTMLLDVFLTTMIIFI